MINENLKQEIIKYYLSQPMTFQQIKDKYNLSLPTISKILENVPKYTKAKIYNPNMDEHFFHTIESEESAYFLGLIIADGNVFKETTGKGRQASISITLDLKDEYMLNNFKKAVKSNTSIGHDGRGCGQIAVRSNIMAQDLSQYGVIPKKTFCAYLPIVDAKWMPHLIRGILDGDGNISGHMAPNNNFYHSIGFCGTHELMQNIASYLLENLKLQKKLTVYDYKNRLLSEVKIQNKHDMYLVGEWLYKDATIFLTRKKEIYDCFKEHYNLN